MAFVTLLDADCLSQVWIRILLLHAARHRLYQAVYSEDILTEVRDVLSRATRGGRALTAAQVNRAIDRLRDDALLVDGYQGLIPAMTNNPKDRHVLAAAVHAHAQAIVTWDLQGFPDEACELYAIQVQNPDDFLANLFDQKPHSMLAAIKDAVEDVDAGDAYTFLMRLQRLERFRDLVLASGLVQIPVESPEK